MTPIAVSFTENLTVETATTKVNILEFAIEKFQRAKMSQVHKFLKF